MVGTTKINSHALAAEVKDLSTTFCTNFHPDHLLSIVYYFLDYLD